jgi:predicted nucleic acid-binding protein
MPERVIVVNTTPLIALAAADCLGALQVLYQRVVVPLEVAEEIRAGGKTGLAVEDIDSAGWLEIQAAPSSIPAYLSNALDRGEAAVIATAINHGIALVCIDETVGRRMARLAGLTLTGSLGVLVKAKQRGYPVSVAGAIDRMHQQGI